MRYFILCLEHAYFGFACGQYTVKHSLVETSNVDCVSARDVKFFDTTNPYCLKKKFEHG